MKFSEFPFLRYVLFFALGILVYPLANGILFHFWLVLVIVVFLGYGAFLMINQVKGGYDFKLVLPLFAYLLLILLGILFSWAKDARNDPQNLVHQGNIKGYMAVVQELDEEKPRSIGNKVKLLKANIDGEFRRVNGEVLIYHQLPEGLQPGEVIWIHGNPQKIPPPKNPGEFDYRQFMARKQIYHSHFVGKRVIHLGRVHHQPITQWTLKIRELLIQKLDTYVTSPYANQVAKALLLGQKSYLDNAVSEAYITAGAMHILAVSGLHVGMIYGFFFLLLKPHRLEVKKRVIYLSLVIIFIWCYALLTGMSPSVMRSATMFTLMGLAQMKSRSPSIFNALALSAFILMVFNPFIIYEVGFQLSYAALLGILLLQPLIVSIWLPKNKLVYYLWEITSVSIAAQLATFPISIHYFHVFPTYFIFSNWVAIPGAFLIMSLGLVFMVVSWWDFMAQWFGVALEKLIQVFNYLIFSFQDWPLSQVDGLFISGLMMVLVWGMITSVYMLANTRKKVWASFLVIIGLFIVGIRWFSWWTTHGQKELIVFSLSEGKAVAYMDQGRLYTYLSGVDKDDYDYRIAPHLESYEGGEKLILQGISIRNGEKIILPEMGELYLGGKGFSFPSEEKLQMARFIGGKWKPLAQVDTVPFNQSAIKIVFN
ncbi:ComEC/Rec2 family competence protein [Echinicola jeungdonensis]|uniref:ComEC/Rec2 family competence protein n=1 Tax=Echinicola jeungdonensis TaxID=709343 RepID=A0ABV5J1A7_9BACT|nr:ComEC/Rec2 family competence protein [Echinicola jeungdonensis]MDN3668431.1 ComEC/Rec2 family competence protein [Echinicola jeungdonensis]